MQERKSMRWIRYFFIGYFALLIVVLTVLGIMNLVGYKLADMSIEFALFAMLLCSALAALAVWIYRRIQLKWLKLFAGSIFTLLILGCALGIMMISSMMMLYTVPMHYTTLTSPAGDDIVVMRLFSRNMEAAEARAETRRSKNPESDQEDYVIDDLAYEYMAYPRFARFFYDSRKPSEGSVEIGCRSGAQLMYDWPDENTLWMYVEDAEDYDSGELKLKLS